MILLKAIAWFSACPGVALQHPKRCFLSLILQNFWTLQLQEVIKETVLINLLLTVTVSAQPRVAGSVLSTAPWRCRCVNEVTFSWNTSAHWPQLGPSDSAQLLGHLKKMYCFRQDKALDSSPSARVLQIREVYGGKHKSNESPGGTRGGRGEGCKLVAANELRTTLLITGRSCSTSGCVSVVSLSPEPALHLWDFKPGLGQRLLLGGGT